jgi:chemotaxis protein MotB
MKADKKNLVIRRKVSIEEHHEHGGSWKLAYADFVTALMAFFLLLWLLNATPNNKLKSVADYFMPTLSIFHEKQSMDKIPIKYGADPQGEVLDINKDKTSKKAVKDNKILVDIDRKLQNLIVKENFLGDMVTVSNSPEGLKIELMPTQSNSLFYQNVHLTNFMKKALDKITGLINLSPNGVSISAYTSGQWPHDSPGDNKWIISATRADAVRSYLEFNGLPTEKVAMITGNADTDLIDPERPEQNINNRVTIILLRKGYTAYYKLPTPD